MKENLAKKISDKNLSEGSFKTKLVTSYIFIAFIPILLVSTLTYTINKNVLINKVSNLSNNVSIQTKLNIDNYLSEIENATSLVFAKDDILVFNPSSDSLTPQEIDTEKSEIKDYLLSISLLQNFNDFVLIYDDGNTIGKVSETTKDMYKMDSIYSDLKKEISDNKNKSAWITGKNDNYTKLYYVKQLNDNTLILTSIYTNELDDIFQSTDENSNSCIALLNESNHIIYSNNKDLISSQMSDEICSNINDNSSKTFTTSDDLVTYNNCNNNWKLINMIPKSYIFKENSTTRIITSFIALICMVLSGMLGFVFSKKISTPIEDIINKMRSAENGDLTVQTEVDSRDELAVLGNSFNNMITNIRNLISETQNATNIVSEKSNEIKQMSNQTYETSENVNKAMESMANGATNQSIELNITLETMDKLSTSIDNINSNITNVTYSSNEAKEIGNNSLEIIKTLKENNENTNKIMKNITSNVLLLVNSVKEIENVLKLINEINEQTNLLSLNASIEAARAGESGKGFAVVAEEIRKLADQSKKSTNEVSNVIKNIYSNADTTVEIIDISKSAFDEQFKSVSYTDNSFKNIIESTEKIISGINSMSDLVKEINLQKDCTLQSTDNIKVIIENSTSNTEEVLAVSEEQSANAQTLSDNSDKLDATVKSLSELLEKFKID